MSSIDNYKLVCSKINRLSNKVRLIAVTKTFSLSHIKPLIDFGHLDYGENKVQEAVEKWSNQIILKKNIQLHMLGKVQSNKVESAAKLFSYIHTLDNEKIAKKFSMMQIKLNKQLKYFIQINIGNEVQKNGINILLAKNFLKFCRVDLKLNILGFMCIPPINTAPDFFFSKLREINQECNLNDLSMGMSYDYETAIKYGATYVRIGSLIFGNRINVF